MMAPGLPPMVLYPETSSTGLASLTFDSGALFLLIVGTPHEGTVCNSEVATLTLTRQRVVKRP